MPSTDAGQHRRSHEAWLSRESTTATLCCTTLHPAPFRSSSEPTTTRRVLFWKRLDVVVYTCPGARCSTTTSSLTLTLSSKMSNCGDIIRWTVYVCVFVVCNKTLVHLKYSFSTFTHESMHQYIAKSRVTSIATNNNIAYLLYCDIDNSKYNNVHKIHPQHSVTVYC